MCSARSGHVQVEDNITPKYLKLETEYISMSKIDNEKEELPTSFLLLPNNNNNWNLYSAFFMVGMPIILDFVLVRYKVSLFPCSHWATLKRSSFSASYKAKYWTVSSAYKVTSQFFIARGRSLI